MVESPRRIAAALDVGQMTCSQLQGVREDLRATADPPGVISAMLWTIQGDCRERGGGGSGYTGEGRRTLLRRGLLRTSVS